MLRPPADPAPPTATPPPRTEPPPPRGAQPRGGWAPPRLRRRGGAARAAPGWETIEGAAQDGLQRAAEDLNAFLDARLAEAGLAPKALALVGFSQGAMMALHVAPRRPQAIAGVVAISGRLLAPEALAAEALVKPPVLLIHGDQDPVVPFRDSYQTALFYSVLRAVNDIVPGPGPGELQIPAR